MNNKKRLPRILWVLLLIPTMSTLILFNQLPSKIPVHWDINGTIDRYLPKFPGAFLIPTVCIIFLFGFIPSIPTERFIKSKAFYYKIASFVTIFFLFLHFTILAIGMGVNLIRFDYMIKFVIGVLILLIGNIIPKLKLDGKTLTQKPWMSKLQRHSGFVLFLSGIICIILAFLPGLISAIIYLTILIIATFEPIFYSYLRYSNIKKDS